ncbi:MAG: adenylosuccinate synthetase [Candidatus Nanoarchaeia archaeon]|nr:adenylosuccinate synthetase [Candidatus Nanoarchaeia archaeon]
MKNQVLEAYVGLQWGDEGKGKEVDEAVDRSKNNNKKTIVVRYQGGTNAGHTTYVKDKNNNIVKFVTHAAPSGLASNVDIAIGPDVAFNPVAFMDEVNQARKSFNYNGRIMISERTPILFDYHKKLDAWLETLSTKKIGTTMSGIGPLYMDKDRRSTRITFEQYISDKFPDRLRDVLNLKARELSALKSNKYLDEVIDEILAVHNPVRKELREMKVKEILEYRLADYQKEGNNIIIEGSQGTYLDVDMGTIPDTTSSHLLAPYAFPSLGLDRRDFKIIGVEKLYPTRVGNGVMPTLDEKDGFGKTVAEIGGEKGATTGRARRAGYPDWVLIKRAVTLNSCDGIIITRADVAQNLLVRPCVYYEYDGTKNQEVPLDISKVKPIYLGEISVQDGSFYWTLWKDNIDLSDPEKVHDVLKDKREFYVKNGFDSLPDGLKKYIKLHDDCVGCKTIGVSIGPGRGETVRIN